MMRVQKERKQRENGLKKRGTRREGRGGGIEGQRNKEEDKEETKKVE